MVFIWPEKLYAMVDHCAGGTRTLVYSNPNVQEDFYKTMLTECMQKLNCDATMRVSADGIRMIALYDNQVTVLPACFPYYTVIAIDDESLELVQVL